MAGRRRQSMPPVDPGIVQQQSPRPRMAEPYDSEHDDRGQGNEALREPTRAGSANPGEPTGGNERARPEGGK